MAIFCLANTNKDNANGALGSCLRVLSLILWETTYFVQNSRTIILPGDSWRTTSELPDVGAKLEAWKLKMFHNFLFLQSDVVFGIINEFFWIFDAVSRKKSCPTLNYNNIEFRTVKFIPPAEIFIGQFKFQVR